MNKQNHRVFFTNMYTLFPHIFTFLLILEKPCDEKGDLQRSTYAWYGIANMFYTIIIIIVVYSFVEAKTVMKFH